MEAKEKAEELVKKYFKLLTFKSNYRSVKEDGGISFRAFEKKAIECSIISIDEMILTLSLSPARVDNVKQTTSYWQEVKIELEKMKG